MVEAFLMMGSLGLVIGAGLAAASKIFYVYVDPLIVAIEDVLPGANCGGCGLPGCGANAEAIVAGKAAPNSCVAGSADLADIIANILGVTVVAKEPDIAQPGCTYSLEDADTKFIYDGLSDCKAAALLSGGMKVCSVGCLGLGSCEKACPFGAISMGPDRLPVVDEKLCTGCGTCERECPKNIINLSSLTRRIIQEYTTNDCTTPCQRSCPAGINIKEYIKQIKMKNYNKALQIIKERNPFPTVIGRICPRPCEQDCRRKFIDEPVAINFLKRYAADYEKKSGKRILPYKAPATGRKIAVVGGGVEGLSASFFAARLGHEPTVFESSLQLGGLLRTAILKNRLPGDILDWDIDGILDIGVKAETGKTLGKDYTIESLLNKGYETVFLASGGWDSQLLCKSENDINELIPGTFLLLDFIKFYLEKENKIQCTSDVVISGGSELALDVAIKLKKQQIKNITVIFRETKKQSMIDDVKIQNIEQEGINIIFNTGISRLFGKGSQLTDIEYVALDSQNKCKIPAKNLIMASGRFPELIFVKSKSDEICEGKDETQKDEPLKWESIEPYKKPLFNSELGLFAKGDVITDYSAAIKAIAAGRRAAVSMHKSICGEMLLLPENVVNNDSVIINVNHVENVDTSLRQIMPLCDTNELSEEKEIEKGFSEDMAYAEASRCLECGLICYKQTKEMRN